MKTQNTAARIQLLATVAAMVLFGNSCTGTGGTHGAQQLTPLQPWAGAWLTPWDAVNGSVMLEREPDVFTDVYFFWALLSAEGVPVLANESANFTAVLSNLKQRKVRSWLTVVNDVAPQGTVAGQLKDAALISRLINDATLRKAHRAQIVALAQAHGFDGVDIDYEKLFIADRNQFTQFISELAVDLHAVGLQLSVTLEPKSADSLAAGPGAADWSEICLVADRMQIMLYNQHSGKTGPGPIATPEWMEGILSYAETQCSGEKIVPILKVIGAAWSDGKVRGVTYSQVMALRNSNSTPVERNAVDLVPHFVSTVDSEQTIIYYEDAESIGVKLKFLGQRGYRSAVVWSLGSYDPAIAAQLRSYLQ